MDILFSCLNVSQTNVNKTCQHNISTKYVNKISQHNTTIYIKTKIKKKNYLNNNHKKNVTKNMLNDVFSRQTARPGWPVTPDWPRRPRVGPSAPCCRPRAAGPPPSRASVGRGRRRRLDADRGTCRFFALEKVPKTKSLESMRELAVADLEEQWAMKMVSTMKIRYSLQI